MIKETMSNEVSFLIKLIFIELKYYIQCKKIKLSNCFLDICKIKITVQHFE